MKAANLGLRFLLELCLLGALGYWGFQTDAGALSWLAGIGAPLAAAGVWGMFVAPNSQTRLSDPLRLGIEVVLFSLGVLALWSAGQPTLALIFAVAVTLSLTLMLLWNQRGM